METSKVQHPIKSRDVKRRIRDLERLFAVLEARENFDRALNVYLTKRRREGGDHSDHHKKKTCADRKQEKKRRIRKKLLKMVTEIMVSREDCLLSDSEEDERENCPKQNEQKQEEGSFLPKKRVEKDGH